MKFSRMESVPNLAMLDMSEQMYGKPEQCGTPAIGDIKYKYVTQREHSTGA